MNSKTKYNTYVRESFCPAGWHHHPDHPKARSDGCMRDSDMKSEPFGAFSIRAAVRGGACRGCPEYVPGIS